MLVVSSPAPRVTLCTAKTTNSVISCGSIIAGASCACRATGSQSCVKVCAFITTAIRSWRVIKGSAMLHYHPTHRARQLRWVLPTVGLLFVAILITLGVIYQMSNQAVETQYFRAHVQFNRTGELFKRGLEVGAVVLTLLLLAIGTW